MPTSSEFFGPHNGLLEDDEGVVALRIKNRGRGIPLKPLHPFTVLRLGGGPSLLYQVVVPGGPVRCLSRADDDEIEQLYLQ